MSHHYSASQDPESYEAAIAALPEPDRSEAESQKDTVVAMAEGLAALYGFEEYAVSVNGAHAPAWASVNVMLTKAP